MTTGPGRIRLAITNARRWTMSGPSVRTVSGSTVRGTMRWALVVLSVVGLSTAAGAEQPDVPPPASRSVYRLDLAWDIPVSVLAAAGVVVPYVTANSLIHPRCPCSATEVPGFDRWAIGYSSDAVDTLSTVTTGLAIVAPLVVDLVDVGASTAFLEDTAVFAETLLVNGALVSLAKYTVQRPVPRAYSPALPEVVSSSSSYTSFYSGHTSITFAALTAASMTWTLRHGPAWWPWVITVVVGTSVGLERIYAGQHFPSDVLVGAAAGTLVGLAVPWLHSRARIGPGTVQLAPLAGGAMLAWGGRF